ncbi:glycosidase [Chloroflexota bacterium]
MASVSEGCTGGRGGGDGLVAADDGCVPHPPAVCEMTTEGNSDIDMDGAEACYQDNMRTPLGRAAQIGGADIVVGVPFYNEVETISPVLEAIRSGLEEYYPDQKCVIVAAGSPSGGKALRVIDALDPGKRIDRIAFRMRDEKISGKGWAVRAIMDVARALGADLAIIEADLRSRDRDGGSEGLSPEWVKLLLEPIRGEKADIVISRFNRHYFDDPVSAYLAYPLVAAIYNRPVRYLMGGQWGISNRLLKTYQKSFQHSWSGEVSAYGIDAWLGTVAVAVGARVCEANLGVKICRKPSLVKLEMVFRQAAKAMFEQITSDPGHWADEGAASEPVLAQPLSIIGSDKVCAPEAAGISPRQQMLKYRQGFGIFHSLYGAVLPEDDLLQLEALAGGGPCDCNLTAELWANIVYHFLLAYAFDREFAKDDLLNALVPLLNGYMAGFTLEMEMLKNRMQGMGCEEVCRLSYLEAEWRIEGLVKSFLRQKPDFLAGWHKRAEALRPALPLITFREFIPGVPLVVPSELTTREGKVVRANEVYDRVFAEQKGEFEQFLHERLQVPRGADSAEAGAAVEGFLRRMEGRLFPSSDLSTVEGARGLIEGILEYLPREQGFAMVDDMASWLVGRCPPRNLPIKMGYGNLADMLKDYGPLDVLALASWSEEREYTGSLWRLIGESVRPEHFVPCAVNPLVVGHEAFPPLVEMKDSSALDKITSRIVVSSLHKGMGGHFPKLRYLTTLTKNIVEAERFGQIWLRFAEERKEFGLKVINSIEGHWGHDPLSAHSLFEAGHQQMVAERLRQMGENIARGARGDGDMSSLAEDLEAVADSYHLALTLPDGKFMTCSAWSWASHSFKGGRGMPPPLSLHVERNWATRRFLLSYFGAMGKSEEELEEKVIELIEQGRESEDLASIMLGTGREAVRIMPTAAVSQDQPPAGQLRRILSQPILEPIKEHSWESKYVLNAGAIKPNGKVYMVYRAFGDDCISRLGLAVSDDGIKFNERLDRPIFAPADANEEKGCEDPRLTLIGDRIFMTYTAYSSIAAQIALASINLDDFTNYRWEKWLRHGMVFPDFTDKDAALFPERFGGNYAMLHRVDPHMWISFSSHLECPWSRQEHKILAGSTSGMMWDGRKIGAGAQPIKTRYGWLLITHGVDHCFTYRLGVMVLDLADPSKLTYRSPNFILEPMERCEVGEKGSSWVPNVVFTCGAVPLDSEKDLLDAEDELLVYYGAADTVLCVASAKVSDLIPEELRRVG